MLIRNGRLEVVKFLLKNTKSNVNAKDEEGRTALHLACGYVYNTLTVHSLLLQ